MRGETIVKLRTACSVLVLFSVCAAPATTFGQEDVEAGVRAGAARIDITPPVEELPAPLTSVHDRIYVRALMVESDGERAVIAVVEVPAIAGDIYDDMVQQISREFDLPAEQVMLGISHTHNSMRVAPPGTSPIPSSDSFTARVRSATLEAIRAAQSRLQPARAGYRAGGSSLVLGRNEWHSDQHRYIDGIDRTGTVPVDQTLGVYEFESLSGEFIAVIINYGITPVVYEIAKTELSGDVPGATSRYVEQALGDEGVAIFTIGAPGSPAYRVWGDEESGRDAKTAETIMNAMGVVLGEEALAQMREIDGTAAGVKIRGVGDSLTCPGKITTPRNLRSHCAYTEESSLPACEFTDAPYMDVTLNTRVLRLGDIAYVMADGNVVPTLWDKLKRASPLNNIQFVGTNFGQFRFVVDDAAYALNTYPATDTRAAAGCAEHGFLTGTLKLIDAVF
jgi:hypothetical protein